MKRHLTLQSLGILLGAFGPALLIAVIVVLFPVPVQATSKFAQETGKFCSHCHTQAPALNDTGKRFKEKGYKL